MQLKGSSLKVSHRYGGNTSGHDTDYKLPSIKDANPSGLSSGLDNIKIVGNNRLHSKIKTKSPYYGDDFNDNPHFTEDNPLFSDVSMLKYSQKTPNVSTRMKSQR